MLIDPQLTFDFLSVEVTCVTLPKDHCVQVPWEYINVCGYNDQFCKIPHTTYIHMYVLKTCGATRNPEFPRTGPDRTETGPGSGNILKNIFGSGRGILFRVRPGRGIFLPGYETFSPGISGIKLPFIPKLRK